MAANLAPKDSVNGHIACDLARCLESPDPFNQDDPKFAFSICNNVRPVSEPYATVRRSEQADQILIQGAFEEGVCNLRGILKGFFAVERLEKTAELDNRYCTDDGTKCDADMWMEIERLPDTLGVQLVRHYYDFEAQRMALNMRGVVYPKEIDFRDATYARFLTPALAADDTVFKRYRLAAVQLGRRRAPDEDYIVWWGYIRAPSCYKARGWYEVNDWRACADYRTNGNPVSEETIMSHVHGGDDGTFCMKLYYRNAHAEREEAKEEFARVFFTSTVRIQMMWRGCRARRKLVPLQRLKQAKRAEAMQGAELLAEHLSEAIDTLKAEEGYDDRHQVGPEYVEKLLKELMRRGVPWGTLKTMLPVAIQQATAMSVGEQADESRPIAHVVGTAWRATLERTIADMEAKEAKAEAAAAFAARWKGATWTQPLSEWLPVTNLLSVAGSNGFLVKELHERLSNFTSRYEDDAVILAENTKKFRFRWSETTCSTNSVVDTEFKHLHTLRLGPKAIRIGWQFGSLTSSICRAVGYNERVPGDKPNTVVALKKTRFDSLPSVLHIDMQRNYTDEETGKRTLLDLPLNCPYTIDFHEEGYSHLLTKNAAPRKYVLAAAIIGQRRTPQDHLGEWWGYFKGLAASGEWVWFEVRPLQMHETKLLEATHFRVAETVVIDHLSTAGNAGTYPLRLFYRDAAEWDTDKALGLAESDEDEPAAPAAAPAAAKTGKTFGAAFGENLRKGLSRAATAVSTGLNAVADAIDPPKAADHPKAPWNLLKKSNEEADAEDAEKAARGVQIDDDETRETQCIWTRPDTGEKTSTWFSRGAQLDAACAKAKAVLSADPSFEQDLRKKRMAYRFVKFLASEGVPHHPPINVIDPEERAEVRTEDAARAIAAALNANAAADRPAHPDTVSAAAIAAAFASNPAGAARVCAELAKGGKLTATLETQTPVAAAATLVFQKHWRARKARQRHRALFLRSLAPQALVFQKHWRGRKRRLAWPLEKLRRQKFFQHLLESTRAQREAEFARRKQALAERARKKMLAEREEGNTHAHATIGNHGKKKGIDRSAERRRTEEEQEAHEKWTAEEARIKRSVEACARQAKAAQDAADAREEEARKAARATEIARGKRQAERWQHAPPPFTLGAFVEKPSVPLSSVDAWKLPSGPPPPPDQEDGRSVISIATTHWPLPTPSTHAAQRAAEHGADAKSVQRTMKHGPVELSAHGTEEAPRLVHRGAPGGVDVVTDALGEVAITVHPAKASKASERARRASRHSM